MAAFFHDDLAPYGRWVDHRIYGIVWVPDSGRPDWHPYYDGRWIWTSDYGWYWHSYEPYGWATYHYGYWALTSDYGWVWVPGYVWGPAWVEWRYGGGYAGWAPMPPPERGSRAEVSASAWIFVTESNFARGNVRAHRVPAARNDSLLRASARVTNYASVNGRIVNRSIDVARIAAAAKVRIAPVRLGTAKSASEQAAASAHGSIAVYRPAALAKFALTHGGSSALDLDLPATLDAEAVSEAQDSLDARRLPDTGSVDSWIGGAVDAAPIRRAPPVGAGGGLGVGVPSVGGIGGGIGIGR
jgi:hypothetical protein